MTEGRSGCGRRRSTGEIYSQLESMPSLPALKSLTKLGTNRVQRTAELPHTEHGLRQ
jgi:hypothetical protein